MGDRPSWRDIDRKRDGRGGSSRSSGSYSYGNQRSKISKAKLDQLFESKKLGDFIRNKEQEKNIESASEDSLVVKTKRALRIQDDEKFLKEARKIIDKDGIPANFEFLERTLAFREIKLIIRILEKMLEMLKNAKKPEFSRALKMQLRILPMKFGDADIERLCSEISDLL